ncbi:MAG TPA: WG repeat-containing protein [Candidatus Stercoripulliclostridium merdipullorum]|uniref:WG repeat-containing protein n=1 Tax=Candidatus Stercoripulliclostridium merdipullorum TaxID=2840952 RepID=A0A9D1SY46_9FIRM|nr:WG repeat-containing protein [Candidatus Stercoripulliclostridium merdipullorum]
MANNRHRHKKRFSPADTYVPPYDAMLLAESVDTLTLTDEVREKLRKGNINTLLDIAKRETKDFYRIPTFNKKNLFELKKAAEAKGIGLKPDTPRPEPNVQPQADAENARQKEASAKQERSDKKLEKGDRKKDNRNPEVRKDGRASDRNSESRKETAKSSDRSVDERRHQKEKDRSRERVDIRNKKGNREEPLSEQKMKEERRKKRPVRVAPPPIHDIYIKINKNGKWGFADRSGKEVIAPIYDEVFMFKEDVCCFERDELFGYIDRQGNEIIAPVYECAASFSEGYACVFKGGVCGYIDKEGNAVIDFQYDAGTPVIDGNCRVKKNGKWGELYIDRPNEVRWII